MSKYVGLDWASKGWLGVILRDDGGYETDHFPTIWSMWNRHRDAERILIDIPIGLPSSEKRACDVEAKQQLGEYGRSVFYTPVRDAVYKQNLDVAKTVNEKAGYSIQNQAWGIVPRIREVDEFIDENPGARDRLFETHPELCFYALNEQTPVRSKKTEEGITKRKELLSEEHPDALSIYREARETYLFPEYASFLRSKDDILDALVCAVTAKRPMNELAGTPAKHNPPRDERGLPMQMLYPSDVNQTRITEINELD